MKILNKVALWLRTKADNLEKIENTKNTEKNHALAKELRNLADEIGS